MDYGIWIEYLMDTSMDHISAYYILVGSLLVWTDIAVDTYIVLSAI